MREYIHRLRGIFVHAAAYSLVANLLLIVPSLFVLLVFDRVLSSRSNETLTMLTLLALVALAAQVAFDAVRQRLLTRAAVAFEAALSPSVVAELLRAAAVPGSDDDPHALRDVQSIRSFLTGAGILALFDLPWLPAYLLIVFAFHPLLGAIALAGSALLLSLAWLNDRHTRDSLHRLQAQSREASTFVDHALRNAEVVAALGMERELVRNWSERSRLLLQGQVRVCDTAGTYTALTRGTRQLLQMAMLAAGAWLVINLHTSPGVMIAGTILLGRALAPVESLIAAWRSLADARSGWQRLDGRIRRGTQRLGRMALPAPAGNLTVESVSFAVPGRELPLVAEVSFTLAAGEALAIVGPSASGKSTLARLVVGAWSAQTGQVRLDGAELGQWERERLGAHLGYLPQDVELFPGTVAQNIARMGEVDDAAVVDAARRAGVHELVLRLPQGYQTPIGMSGAWLSGGQRQRIALARALYRSPRLLVLDEPNANLDAEGEAALLDALRGAKAAGTTVVMVVHRPALLRDVDKVLVLREGRVESFGARDEILKRFAPHLARIRPAAVDRPAHIRRTAHA